LFAAALCAFFARFAYQSTPLALWGKPGILISIGLAVPVYAFALAITRSITRNDLLRLKNGEKIANTLAKIRILG
jgi:hypothetical protein